MNPSRDSGFCQQWYDMLMRGLADISYKDTLSRVMSVSSPMIASRVWWQVRAAIIAWDRDRVGENLTVSERLAGRHN